MFNLPSTEEDPGEAGNQPFNNRPGGDASPDLSRASAPESHTHTTKGIVRSGDVDLHYLQRGSSDNPMLMMLHGTALTAEAFDEVAPQFVDRYNTITPHLRGHGASGWHPDGLYEHAECVEDIDVLRTALGQEEPMVLVGHSISGLHAMRYASEFPERVSALVLVDVLPTIDGSVMEHLFDFVLSEYDSLESAVEAAQRLSPGKDEAEIAAALSVLMTWDEEREVFRYRSDPAFVSKFAGADISEFWSDLAKVHCPVLLVLGGESRLIPPDALVRFLQLLPQAEVASVPEARHSVMVDNPEQFSEEVSGFLERIISESSQESTA